MFAQWTFSRAVSCVKMLIDFCRPPLVLYPVLLSCLHRIARTRQMAHLIKLRTKGEEVLSSRLKHAEEDCKRAIERAERAEARIRKQEQELADLRENA